MKPVLRDLQKDALKEIEGHLKKGKKHIIVQAPTGTGKSIIALELAKKFNESYILTADFYLQQQYEQAIKEFTSYNFAEVIASGNQYTCHKNGRKVKTHGECVLNRLKIAHAAKLECAPKCKYFIKRINAPLAKSVITNYAFFLKHMNYTRGVLGIGADLNSLKEVKQMFNPLSKDDKERPAPFIPRKFVILDEAHRLAEQVQGSFSFEIGPSSIKSLIEKIDICRNDPNIYLPIFSIKWGNIAKALNSIAAVPLKDKEGLIAALTHFRDVSRETYKLLIPETKLFIGGKWEPGKVPPPVHEVITQMQNFENTYCRVDDYISLIKEHGLYNLIVSYTRKNHREFNFFKDDTLVNSTFHKWGDTFIYMSATIGDPKLFAKRMGITDYAFINIDPNWDFQKSPVLFCNSSNFSFKNKDKSFKDSMPTIKKILISHPNERGIIHTGTYEFAKYIKENLKNKRLVFYEGTKEKTNLIEKIKNGNLAPNSVIVGPSLFEGVDLPDDLCRFQIISKLQYPNLSNSLWATRCYSSERYIYLEKPFVDLIQAIGRGNRNKNDFSYTYLLDTRFVKYLNKRRLNSLTASWRARFQNLKDFKKNP